MNGLSFLQDYALKNHQSNRKIYLVTDIQHLYEGIKIQQMNPKVNFLDSQKGKFILLKSLII